MKKSWLSIKSPKNHLAPNLEPDLPKFTPFNNEEDDGSIHIYNNTNDNNNSSELIENKQKEEDDVKENKEPFQLNKDDESFIDKLLPFSDYVYDIYDNFKNSKIKKQKKMHKKKHYEEINEDQKHDDNIGNEFTTESITTEKQDNDESAMTMVDFNTNQAEFSDAGDNAISIEEETSAESIDTNLEHFKNNNKFLRYNVGPGVNVSLDVPNEVVRVQLDENCLKDVFTGRGKKKELITKTLALFILPFLIQTSFVPFLLTTIKLMLVNSMVVGKIAILLFLIALFKNHKLSNTSEAMPYYLDTSQSHHLHHRRSEIENKGYLAVGKPETYIT